MYKYRLFSYPYSREERNMLFAQRCLVDRWIEKKLVSYGVLNLGWELGVNLGVIAVDNEYKLEPVASPSGCKNKLEALVFAHSLRESRQIEPDAGFQDAIFSERHKRLLPTWTDSEPIADDVVFTRWLTGGESIPFESLHQRKDLVSWLECKDIAELADAAGFM